MSRRLRPIWILAGMMLFIFMAFRVSLLVANFDFVRDEGLAHVGKCFWVGLRFDLVPMGYMLFPLVLLLSLSAGSDFGRPKFQRLIAGYGTALILITMFVEVVGAAYFADSGARLNWAVLNYPRHPKEVIGHIWTAYPAWLFLPAVPVLTFLLYRLFRKLFCAGQLLLNSVKSRLSMAVVLAGVCVLFCRGGVANLPLSSGSAYFSVNNVISQLAMNNFFTFFRAARATLNEGANEAKEYDFPPLERAQQEVAQMLAQDGHVSAGLAGNPLWRKVQTGRPMTDFNVVVILMEGMAGRPVGALGYKPSYTPNLDEICRSGLFFERMYAVGSRTSRGIMGVLCGHPDMTGISILERQQNGDSFLTLPEIFNRRGYETLFVYGGDANFDNMRGFFSAGGIDKFIDESQMEFTELPGNWGMPDEVIFDKAHEAFVAFAEKGDKKFFSVILTVTNHQPYQVPAGRVDMLPGEDTEILRLNAYRYADWALGRFFDKAGEAEYFDKTIFVLVADHGQGLNLALGIDVPGYRLPCVIYAPSAVTPKRISVISSQVDIAPTLLSLMGGKYEHCFLGRDILSVEPGDGFAVLHQDDYLGIVSGDRAMILPPKNLEPDQFDQPVPILFELDEFFMRPIAPGRAPGELVDKLRRQMLSYYLVARHLYTTDAYRFPAEPVAHQSEK